MTLACNKLEFSWNFARFRRFGSQLQHTSGLHYVAIFVRLAVTAKRTKIATECNPDVCYEHRSRSYSWPKHAPECIKMHHFEGEHAKIFLGATPHPHRHSTAQTTFHAP